MSKMIPRGGKNILGGNYYAIYNIIGEIASKLGNDVESILNDSSGRSPSGFLKQAYSQSSSRAVYYAPRNPNDGFPPRQNSLKNTDTFGVSVGGIVSSRGFKIHDDVEIKQGNHTSFFGKTKGQSVYPWTWIDEGTTWRNRFSGNPRNINQAFTRDWHAQGYRDIFINKMGSQLRGRGWDVVR